MTRISGSLCSAPLLVVILLAISGCGPTPVQRAATDVFLSTQAARQTSTAAYPPPATLTAAPPATTRPAPSQTPQPGTDFLALINSTQKIFLIQFSGSGCSFSAPGLLPKGNYGFRLDHQGDQDPNILVSQVIGEQTLQDLEDYWNTPDPIWPDPARFIPLDYLYSSARKLWVYPLTISAEYSVVVFSAGQNTGWLCGSLQIVDNSLD
jgi:hypothetical protein